MGTTTKTATSSVFSLVLICIIIIVVSGHLLPPAAAHPRCSFDAIYQFGDSISDTGNLIREDHPGAFTPFAHLPYGETFFNKPTGRCTNGRLMIDFLAQALGLPLLNPYLEKDANFRHGVNFAVAGSTALDTSVLFQKRILSPVTNSSLNVQFNWFKDHLDTICNTKTECANILKRALFMVGEVGGNDINYALLQGKTTDEVQTNLVPDIVNNIIDIAKKFINLGATRLAVPGNFPIGCLPIYLTAFENTDNSSYDEWGCLKNLNKLAAYQNQYLQTALTQLRAQHPTVMILYADYYNAFQWVFRTSSHLGFETESVRKACCGTGGEHNFNLTRMCGMGVPACSNPDKYISWDGIHLTQKAYQYMADWFFPNLWLRSGCIY